MSSEAPLPPPAWEMTSVAVQPVAFSTITVALAVFVSVAPILSASLMLAPTQLLTDLVPLVGRMLSSMLRGLTRACEGLRSKREQTFVLLHGALTYMVGDLVAQAASDSSDWLPVQTARAAAIGIVTDTLPFYHWSSLLSSIDDPASPIREALFRKLPMFARRPARLLPLKIAAHLASFQPLSTAGYLFLQGLSKGHRTIGGALAFLRQRFAAAILPALATFLFGGPIIYSLPVVAGAALRNLGVLGMCVYLAVVSSS